MNLLDVLRQDKNYRLGEKIESYGRVYDVVNGKDMERQGAVYAPEVRDIVDFEELEQGCLTYVEGEDYPMRGCFQNDRCIALHQVKRLIPVMARTLKSPIGIIYLYLFWKDYLEYIHFSLRDVYYPELKCYSQPVIEVYSLIKNEKLRDIICAILEFDNGYRFPFQDIVSEINKDNFNKNPIKELKRLFDLLMERSNGYFASKANKRFTWLLNFLILKPKLLRELKNIVNDMDIDEIKLSKEDIYWVKRNNSIYKYNS